MAIVPAPPALPPQTLAFDFESAGHTPDVTHVVLQSNQQDSPPGLEQQLAKDLVQCMRRFVFRRSMHQWRQRARAFAERLTRLVQLSYKLYRKYCFKHLFNKTVGEYKIRNCIVRRLRSTMALLRRATKRHFLAHFRAVVAFESHKRKLWARRHASTLLRNASLRLRAKKSRFLQWRKWVKDVNLKRALFRRKVVVPIRSTVSLYLWRWCQWLEDCKLSQLL